MFFSRLRIWTNRAQPPRPRFGARRAPPFRPCGEELEDRCVPAVVFSENFDGVTTPALPAGWTSAATGAGAVNWSTSTTRFHTGSNSAFVPNGTNISDDRLTSPVIAIPNVAAALSFQHTFDFDSIVFPWDGGVLEISINAGAFADIVAAGGTFVAGGYNGTINSGGSNPLGNRQGWTISNAGGFGTFMNTIVDLPAAALGQNIQLRWREGSGSGFGRSGWYVDTVSIHTTVLRAMAGGPQSTMVTTPFPTNLQVRARDGASPVSGVLVTFTAPGAGASVTFPSGNTAITDVNGLVNVPVVANDQVGSYTVTANAAGYLSTSFSLSNTPVPTTTSMVSSASPAAGTAGHF